jgi:hypothetical protein
MPPAILVLSACFFAQAFHSSITARCVGLTSTFATCRLQFSDLLAARLAVKAKSESARIAAIRELLDRGYGKPTQFLAAGTKIIPDNITGAELRAQLIADFARVFPEFELVPRARSEIVSRKRLTLIEGMNEAT